jgi:protocatechuate 3,4-dioxygenase beta subunit
MLGKMLRAVIVCLIVGAVIVVSPAIVNATVTDLTDTPNIDFTLGPGGSISGVVTDGSGNPIAGASVYASGNSWDYVSTGADGSYTIANLVPGQYEVLAQADGYANDYYNNVYDWSAATLVTVTDLTDTPNIDFTLGPGGSISGVVTDGSGNPIEGASVSASGDSSGSGSTGADGSYTIANLVPGKYTVSAWGSGYVMEYYNNVYDSSSATPVTVTDVTDMPHIDFTLLPGGSISGVVTDGSGNPIVGASVSASGNSSGSAATGEDGSYTIANLAPGQYVVLAQRSAYVIEYYNNVYDWSAATPVTVTDVTDIQSIDFTLGPGGSISGVVTDGSGNPIVGASVSASGNSSDSASTGADGSYTIASLAPGKYEVSAQAGGYANEYYNNVPDSSAATPVTVTDLTDIPHIDFTLGPGFSIFSISGVVKDGSGNPVVGASVSASGSSSGSASTGADGSYTIANLAAGYYVVRAEASGCVAEYYDNVYDQSSATPVALDDTPPTTPVVTDQGATTTTTGLLHASWSSGDPESGIAEYQYAIGTTSGGTDITDWTSVGSDTQETKTGLSLNVGTTYYFGVKAKNDAGLWSAVGVSDGIAVIWTPDTTPPTTPVVTDEGATTTSTSQLYASWSSGDPESGIAEYQYAIGTTSGGTDVVNWTSVGTDTAVTRTELNLTAGTAYCFAVKARNGEGLWSSVGTSDGIIAQKSAVGGNGGMPSWVWIVVGIVGAAVAVIALFAAIGFLASRPKPKKPAATDQTTDA